MVVHSENLFGELIVSHSPQRPGVVADLNSHNEMTDCFLYIFVAMRTVVETFGGFGAMGTAVVVPLFECEPVDKNSEFGPGPLIVAQSGNFIIELFDGFTDFVVSLVA